MPFASIALCALGACAKPGSAPPSVTVAVEAPVPRDQEGRVTILAEDATRIETIDKAWQATLAQARGRNRALLAAEGQLLTADAALEYPELPPGSYNCRVIRLGDAAGPRKLRVFPSFFCYIRGEPDGKRSFMKQTGSDLPSGWLYPDNDRRYLFLGARQLREGDTSLGYGTQRGRDLAGVAERVGPFRWRLTIPTRGNASLDVYELTPVATKQQGPG